MGNARNALDAAAVAPIAFEEWAGIVSDQSDYAVSGEGPKVKANFQAVGNSHHNTGGGADDTEKIQDAINAAHAANVGEVQFEPGSYRITSPLKMHSTNNDGGNIKLVGLGPRNNPTTRGPTLVWDGPTDGTPRAMLDYEHTVATNEGASPIENLVLAMRWIENASAIRYHKKVDLGTYLKDVWFQRVAGDGVIYELGATNAYIYHSRWDDCTGFAVRMNVATNSFFSMKDCTWATGFNSDGFFFADRPGGTVNDVGYFYFENINTEVQVDLNEAEEGGANPADRRGLYHLTTNDEQTSTQYIITFKNLKHDTASNQASYSVFLARGGGTPQQRGRRFIITGDQFGGMGGTDFTAATGYKKPLGNVHANMMATGNFGTYARFEHKPQNTEIFGAHRAQTWVYTGTD